MQIYTKFEFNATKLLLNSHKEAFKDMLFLLIIEIILKDIFLHILDI